MLILFDVSFIRTLVYSLYNPVIPESIFFFINEFVESINKSTDILTGFAFLFQKIRIPRLFLVRFELFSWPIFQFEFTTNFFPQQIQKKSLVCKIIWMISNYVVLIANKINNSLLWHHLKFWLKLLFFFYSSNFYQTATFIRSLNSSISSSLVNFAQLLEKNFFQNLKIYSFKPDKSWPLSQIIYFPSNSNGTKSRFAGIRLTIIEVL